MGIILKENTQAKRKTEFFGVRAESQVRDFPGREKQLFAEAVTKNPF